MRTSPLLVVRPLDLRSPYNSFYRVTSHLSSIDSFGGSVLAPGIAFQLPPTSYFSSACFRQLGGDDQSMVKGSEDKLKSYFAQPSGRQRRRDGPSPSESQARSTVNRSPVASLNSDTSGPNVGSSKAASSSSQRSSASPHKSRSALSTLAKVASQSRSQNEEFEAFSDHDSDCSSSSQSTCISSASSNTSVGSIYPERMWKQKKKELVDKLMVHFFAYFRPWIEDKFGIESCSDGEHDGGSRQQNSQSAGQGGKSTNRTSTTSRKRQQRHYHDEDDEMNPSDEDDGKGDGRKRNTKRARQDSGKSHQRRFACPYYKHDPQSFSSSRTCRSPGYDTIHRLKEHLKRKHLKPPYHCNRCLENLESEQALENHQRLDIPCVKRMPTKDTRLSRTQLQAIEARKPTLLTEHERWEKIYGTIFPGEPLPKSPYCHGELTELQNLGEFLDKELPPLYRNLLVTAVDQVMGDMETGLKCQLVDKVPSLLKKLVEAYCNQNSLGKQHHRDSDSNVPLARSCRDSNANIHATADCYDLIKDHSPQPTSTTSSSPEHHQSNIDLDPFDTDLLDGVDSNQLFNNLMNEIGDVIDGSDWDDLPGLYANNGGGGPH
ncbi:hypothetical protein MCOR07_003315 [Pyricularia oryzae]|nr:hypothetical protein MCOR01_004673 [Pyricularia oryzae]KAI6329876.1 hypothetical protein MCOR30_005371 [Pyricularia oryzae]KAI6624647.1 hypothetical protein MCOR07_003315 [Pyricularia oryzae]